MSGDNPGASPQFPILRKERFTRLCPVIGVAGGSGSGKSTVVNALRAAIAASSAILSQDLYYRDLSHLSPAERSKVNFDHPDSLDFSLMSQHINALAGGYSVVAPVYDFQNHVRKGRQTISPGEILFIEGTLILTSPEIRRRINWSVFLDAPDAVRFERRFKRDQVERGRTARDIRIQYERIVRPMHQEFIEPSKSAADCVLDGSLPCQDVVIRFQRELNRRFSWVNCP
ncbi:MAG: uridine kinase [Candidatus Omnitrophica bacterium]|nr:uridine kinase [Candidatus Omnitrophota bacterium]